MRLLRALAALLLATPAVASITIPGVPSLGTRIGFNVPIGTVSGPFVNAASQPLGSGSGGIFDSGNAEGWTVTCLTCTVGQTFSVTRQGYTTAAATTTYTQTRTVTKQLRQAYPNQASLNTANLWALDDYVLSTDTPAGFVNNSTLIAPKPVCNWDEPARQLVSASVHVGIACFSRDAGAGGQGEVAAIVVTATDGTHTVSQTIAGNAMQVSAYGGDQNAVVDYEATLSLSTLNDNSLITVNATVYPWIGGSGSVLTSSGDAVLREFSPRYYLKNTTRAAAPYMAFVAPTAAGSCATAGVDASGVWSTTQATAAAHCFATRTGALNAITTASGIPVQTSGSCGTVGTCLPAGATDGAIIYLSSTETFSGTNPGVSRPQYAAALIITRDPAVTRANAIYNSGSFAAKLTLATAASTLPSGLTESAVVFRDMTLVRGSNTAIISTAGGAQPPVDMIWDQINFNNGSTSNTITLLSNSHLYAYGVAASNVASSALASTGGAGVTEVRILRGMASTGVATYDPFLILGSTFTTPVGFTTGARSSDHSIFAFNKILQPGSGSAYYTVCGDSSTDGVLSGAAFVQNLAEVTHTNSSTGGTFFSIDAGSTASNVCTNVITQYNTLTGALYVGRQFWMYDQTVGIQRPHRFNSALGNIWLNLANKVDWFDGANNTDTTTGANSPNNRTGAWSAAYGVGSVGNFNQYYGLSISGGPYGNSAFSPMYFGLRGNYIASPSPNSTWNNPLFTSYQGTTVTGPSGSETYTAGAGGGDYHLQSGSPCKANVPVSGLPYGLDGSVRPATNDSCGAYP